MDHLKILGQNIKTHRKALGVSQNTFSMMVGMNKTYLSDIERGKGNVSFLTLAKIAKGLNVKVEELVDGL